MARGAVLSAAVVALAALAGPSAPVREDAETRRILVFSKTAGFRHSSIPDGVAALRRLGSQNGFEVDWTEDASAFDDARLPVYDAVVFLLTTGDVLSTPEQGALERYVGSGRGFVGIHSAADTEHGWPWYGELLGARFVNHPEIQDAVVRVSDRVHASTRGLPERWPRVDEWYNFAPNPRAHAGVHVLATLDETTYSGGTMGADHPIAWCHFSKGGRSWYTAMGHTSESYSEARFLAHVLGGIQFAAGWPDCDPQPRTRSIPPR
jgi:type 1 glutamine amidotransferase